MSHIISQFFSDKSVTRAECDNYATSKFGGPVKVVEPQGRFSYTITATNDTVIIQFREKNSSLPTTDVSELLLRTHGELIAPYTLVCALGGTTPNGLDVYKMNRLPGINCSNPDIAELLEDEPEAMGAFIDSLAGYVTYEAILLAISPFFFTYFMVPQERV